MLKHTFDSAARSRSNGERKIAGGLSVQIEARRKRGRLSLRVISEVGGRLLAEAENKGSFLALSSSSELCLRRSRLSEKLAERPLLAALF